MKPENLPPLNLPTCPLKITGQEGQWRIYDQLRRQWVALTPEEWVRQHVVHWLIASGYPPALMQTEVGLVFNNLSKRTDVLVLARDGSPFMLAECKAPTVKVDMKVLEQVLVYNQTIRAEYLLLSNGRQHVVVQVEKQSGQIVAQLSALPPFAAN